MTLTDALLADLARISADAVICVDAQQKIRFYNEGAEKIFGWTREEALGQPLDILIPERARTAHVKHMERFREAPERARRMGERQEIAGLRKNGEEFPAEAAIAKVGSGKDMLFSVVMRDITEQVQLYKRLQRAVALRDETVGVVAHDLRNPVSAVKMLAQALARRAEELKLGEEEASQLRLIREAALQMDRLIQDLLDVTRVEAGRLEVELQPVKTQDMLESAVRTLRPLVKEAGHLFDVVIPGALPPVLADVERVQQVLSNLIGNAIKFTPRGGKITLTATEHADSIRVSVTDTGQGIAPDHLPNIFDRFWQSATTGLRTKGAGLGLPIAQGIVRAHNGRLWAESEIGRGSTFHFTLPRADVSRDAADASR